MGIAENLAIGLLSMFFMIIFFVGSGMFDDISTWIEAILRPRGLSISRAGMMGGIRLTHRL